ncbi:MAG: ABC transporter ATP-binding protein [Clostridia bacterium]|nr:ABC transporter ATP-binding protein [Clostridia bacterium]
MIELQKVKKCYGERTVLDIESLHIGAGEIAAFAGANGSGKTTLLRLLSGVEKASEGKITIPAEILYMPQQCYAFRGNLIKNITLGSGDKAAAMRLLEALELSALAEKPASSLSGGELQRLALCRLLARECKVLLLDEPTSACDARGEQLVMQAVREYQKAHSCTVLMTTHSPVIAAQGCDRLVILNSGNIEADGVPREVLMHPETAWAKSFIARWKIEC